MNNFNHIIIGSFLSWRRLKNIVEQVLGLLSEKQSEQQVFILLLLPMLSTTATIPRVTDYISEHELNLMVMPGPASSIWTEEDLLSEPFTSAYTCRSIYNWPATSMKAL